jgi:hypothetical protein
MKRVTPRVRPRRRLTTTSNGGGSAFFEGHDKYGGRKSGTKNYITRCMKTALLEAANIKGGEAALIGYFLSLDEELFAQFMLKLLPLQVTGHDGHAIRLEHDHRHAHLHRLEGVDVAKLTLGELTSLYTEEIKSPPLLEQKSNSTDPGT